MKMSDFRLIMDPKPPLNEVTERENLERKLGPTCWRGMGRENLNYVIESIPSWYPFFGINL